LYTTKGVVTVTLGFTLPVSFTYKLTYGDDREDKLNGVSIGRHVLQEMTENRLTYYFRAPHAGDYFLTVFAREVDDDIQKPKMVFRSVCDFKIASAEAAPSTLKSFPYCSDSSWGLDSYVRRYSMVPNTKAAILMCPSGKGEVSFEKEPRIKVYARLVYPGKSFAELKNCVKITEKDGGGHVVVAVELPGEGEYGLEVFGNDKALDGETFAHFSQYLCTFLPPNDFVKIYGRVSDRVDLQDSEEPEGEEPEYQPHDASIYTRSVSMKPPGDFKPAPLSARDTAERPPPSYHCKRQFSSIDVFQNVDNHARTVAKEPHGSFRELIWHLIYVRNITNDLDKLRAIFVYLCSMDLRKLNFKKPKKETPEELLMKLKSGDTTYSRVFETLCSYAGLQCHTVPGIAKGVDYQPGDHFKGDQGQHSWNAVKVNGTWQLIDCNWAARRLVGKETAAESIRYELDEYYFLPLPQQLIYTHLPQDPLWQLIRRPITREQFEELVNIKSTFFKFGLQLVSHKEAVIADAKEEVAIQIRCPLSKAKQMRFTFKLIHEDLGETYGPVQLTQFGMQQMNHNICVFTVRLPEKGRYRFVMYAKDTAQPQTGEETTFSGVGEYEIVCVKPQDPVMPFPPCSHTSWGPGDSVGLYQLAPRHKNAVVRTRKGVVEVRVTMHDNLRFTGKLKSVTDREDYLARYLLTRVIGKEAIFVVNAPHVGEFGLEVYANNPSVDGHTLHHVYQYLVVCDEPLGLPETFPALTSGYLGAQPAFQGLGLSVFGAEDPYLVVDSGDTHVSFEMKLPVRMSSQLLYINEKGESVDCSEYVLQQSGNNLATFMLKLPQVGMYKLQIYAVEFNNPSDNLPGVYNFLINCRNTLVSGVPFPKQYAPWKDGCYLYEPLDGHLQPNRPTQGSASSYQHVMFLLVVPRATSVMVVIGEEWLPLTEEQQGQWRGEVQMDQFWGTARKVTVCVSYDNPPDSYNSLLEYSM